MCLPLLHGEPVHLRFVGHAVLVEEQAQEALVDAADVKAAPIARVHRPRRVPFGFHGNWIADDEIGE
jgi:carotenoid cleavage dioxygenase-like enzyme